MPEALIVAGPNGAGKTTFAQDFLRDHAYVYLGADQLAAELAPDAPQEARIQAGRSFIERLHEVMEARASVVLESTLAGRSLLHLIDRLREVGYGITVLFIFLDSADLCLARVAARVQRGGHAVPEADVRRRFTRSRRNFWTLYRFRADRWHLFYNAGERFEEVALGEGENYQTSDEARLHLFLHDLAL